MVEASSSSLGQGTAWKRIRLEVLLLSASLMIAGAALFFLPWPQSYSSLLKALGAGLVLAGAIVAATRPWNFMKRMEMQLLVHKERLQGQISDIRRQSESGRVDEDAEERR
ncbi:MAG: hypothetical protein LUQ39_04560 [Methanomassiliicoccales archaeon]|nr:hypothetical protein [Methanomassiliicoccales archaeon]